MRFAFIDAEKAPFRISGVCQTFGANQSGFFAWQTQIGEQLIAAHSTSRPTWDRPGAYRSYLECRSCSSRPVRWFRSNRAFVMLWNFAPALQVHHPHSASISRSARFGTLP